MDVNGSEDDFEQIPILRVPNPTFEHHLRPHEFQRSLARKTWNNLAICGLKFVQMILATWMFPGVVLNLCCRMFSKMCPISLFSGGHHLKIHFWIWFKSEKPARAVGTHPKQHKCLKTNMAQVAHIQVFNKSALATALLENWADNQMPATTVQHLAAQVGCHGSGVSLAKL